MQCACQVYNTRICTLIKQDKQDISVALINTCRECFYDQMQRQIQCAALLKVVCNL